MSNAFESMLARQLRGRIDAEIAMREEVLLNGTLSSYEQYKFALGRRYGLQDALKALDEVEKELSNPDPKVRRTG